MRRFSAFNDALKECTRDRFPSNWALTQADRGDALRIIGERETGTAALNEAVSAFNEALKRQLSPEQAPIDWASSSAVKGS